MSGHDPQCDSYDFDPEKQLGPDKPCNCRRTPNPRSMTDEQRAENICDYVRMGAGRDDIRNRVIRLFDEVRADVAAHFASNLPAIEDAVRAEEREARATKPTGLVHRAYHEEAVERARAEEREPLESALRDCVDAWDRDEGMTEACEAARRLLDAPRSGEASGIAASAELCLDLPPDWLGHHEPDDRGPEPAPHPYEECPGCSVALCCGRCGEPVPRGERAQVKLCECCENAGVLNAACGAYENALDEIAKTAKAANAGEHQAWFALGFIEALVRRVRDEVGQ